jgi:tetratricopeptide (TPR) repeat protein
MACVPPRSRPALEITLWVLLALAPIPLSAQVTSAAEAKRISAMASADSKAGAGKMFAQAFRLLQDKQFQAAVDLYDKGLALDPANAAARYYFGLAHSGLGNEAAARTQYQLVASLAPDSEAGAIAKGILLEHAEQRSSTVDGCW